MKRGLLLCGAITVRWRFTEVYMSTRLHGVTSQKSLSFTFIASGDSRISLAVEASGFLEVGVILTSRANVSF
jgi:hypothetical protein